jgi:hypothetical protein
VVWVPREAHEETWLPRWWCGPALVAALLCLICVVWPGPASAAACRVPRHGVLLRTAKVRVWRDPPRLLACTPGHSPRVLIKRSFPYGDSLVLDRGTAPVLPMRPERLAARGYVVSWGAVNDVAAGIWARDLRRPLRQVKINGEHVNTITGAEFEYQVVIGDLQIGPRGDVAAIVCRRFHGRALQLARTCLRAGLLDSVVIVHPGVHHRLSLIATGRRIQPHSLHADGARFSWLDGHRRRHARFRESSRSGGCAHAGRTVARSRRVRILRRALPSVDEAHAPLSACRLPHGVIRVLGGDLDNVFVASSDVFGVEANLIDGDPIGGVHVAYNVDTIVDALPTGPFFGPSIAVTGRDPGRAAHAWVYPRDLLQHGGPARAITERLYLTPAGSAVWSATASGSSDPYFPEPASALILAINGLTGEHLTLARDAAIDPDSLHLDGRRASWLNAGATQYADLP